MKQHKLCVMDKTGDSEIAFNPTDADQVAKAQAKFDELTKGNHLAFRKSADGKDEIVRSFDPNAEETVFMPPLVGG